MVVSLTLSRGTIGEPGRGETFGRHRLNGQAALGVATYANALIGRD